MSKEQAKKTIDRYLTFSEEENFNILNSSSTKFKSFILEEIKDVLSNYVKLDRKIYLKYILNKIYIKYDYNIEIFNVFILEIMQIFSTMYKHKYILNKYKISYLLTPYINYYLNDINYIYLHKTYNNHYIGIIIDLILSNIVFNNKISIEVFFMNNILHKYFSFNIETIHLMENYYTKTCNLYTNYDFIEYDKQYNFFDIYKYFNTKYNQETNDLIKLYEQCSNIRLLWIATCIRYIIYNFV